MMNRKRTRVLTTLVLAAAILGALGSEARATIRLGPYAVPTIGSKAPKSGTSPLSGEPDSGNSSPLPPKSGSYPTSGANSWALRVQWLLRTWLGNVPRRFF